MNDYQPDAFDTELLDEVAPKYTIRTDMTLPEQLERALVALKNEPHLYWQPTGLVQVIGGRLIEVSRGILTVMVERRCNVHRQTPKGLLVPCRPDDALLSALLSLPAPGPLRELSGLRPLPTVRGDGSPYEPGYDPESKYVQLPYPIEPGHDLRALLDDLLADYTVEARAAWLAAAVGQVARPNYSTQPGWIVSANQPSCGKTTLLQTLYTVLAGRPAPVRMLPESDSELVKDFASSVASGPLVIFDNCSDIRSNAIEAYISSPTWSYRVLGRGLEARIDTGAMVSFSSNNARVRRDLASRCMVTDIQAGPVARRWKHPDWYGKAIELRPAILGALLDLCGRIESYEWAELGRHLGWNSWGRAAALQVYGVDVLTSTDGSSVDEESDTLESLVGALRRLYGNEPFQAGAISDDEAREALSVLARVPMVRLDARNIGLVLGRYKNRWVGNTQITSTRVGPSRRAGWRLHTAPQ